MLCPACGDPHATDDRRCPDCGVTLVPRRRARARLGRFHPLLAPAVVELARSRGAAAATAAHDEGVDVLVDAGQSDTLRGEVVVSWDDLLARLDVDDRAQVLAEGGRVPGWADPPDSVWVDREGRLQAARIDEESRTLGPAVITVGLILLLVGWYAGAGSIRLLTVVLGLSVVLVGVFLPR